MDSASHRFTELINEPAAERHLDLLCALVAATVDPAADVAAILLALDRLAEACPSEFDGIMSSLFGSGLFSGDVGDYHDPRNSLLHHVLARRVGMPITLSVVAMEIGKRVGVPIVGVGMPGHFVVRDAASPTYADPFAGGVRYDEVGIVSAWQRRMGHDAPFHHAMLAPTSTRDIVLRILNNLKHSLVSREEWPMLARLVPLRVAFPELAGEAAEHRRWMRHFN
ncbi:MAG TPA: transglutaminase-like domain-containing protein [Ilumatobacteraceae bacterium]|jgi:regulator of sirC expression with transglutaminase-like and TPR domain